jgi:exodeoxyribonuclease VII small subunit
MTKKISYSGAVAELEKIYSELENNSDVNVDLIIEKIKRASELIIQCKQMLHGLNEEIEKQLDAINFDD